MSKLAGIFILGILAGWVMEWIFVRLFVPNPKKKLETALQASRKENDNLQKQNRELQATLNATTAENTKPVTPPVAELSVKTPIAEPEAVAAEPTTPVADALENDDLTKLSGIGPKLAEAMNAAGINRYAQLAELSIETVGERLASSGIRYSKASAESWAAQAALADKSDWTGLKTYQLALKN
jgi:predicted flap endonuclease-1-like 5' DNA nuclease